MKIYKNKSIKYLICDRLYKVEKHQGKMIDCTNDKKKICFHVLVLYINYEGNYILFFIIYR